MIYTSLTKEHIAEICEVCETSYLIRFMGGKFARVTSKEIKPIPLTPEILKKSGWFEDSFLDNYKSFYKNDRIYPSLHGQNTQNGYAFDIDIGETNIMTNVKYVHQLQHLLFGLGLNSEMEV